MTEELVKEKLSYYDMIGNMREDLRTASAKYDLSYAQQDTVYENYANKNMAKELIDMGWTKTIWHKVSENDLPIRQGQKVWLCTTSKDYFMAKYYDDTPLGGQQFFEVASAGSRITLSNVLAWMELPKYEEK